MEEEKTAETTNTEVLTIHADPLLTKRVITAGEGETYPEKNQECVILFRSWDKDGGEL